MTHIEDDPVNFIEHCILVAAGSDQQNDGEAIQLALRLTGEAFWPDLAAGAFVTLNVETDELVVETPNAITYIAIRTVTR
jgi:hypothetical protein